MTDSDLFVTVKRSLEDQRSGYNIGTYNEQTQHMLLKLFYEPDINCHEVSYAGYIADILNDRGITEIQTVGFRALHDKLAVYLSSYPVTVVYPVSQRQRICWIDPETGESSFGRYTTYPKAKYKIIAELLSILPMFPNEKLSLHIVSMDVSRHRLLNGYGSDKKKKATKLDTVPEELLNITVIKDLDDIRAFLPFHSGDIITSNDISSALGLKRRQLWRAIKFLTLTEIIIPDGKKGNAVLYKFT